MKRCRSDKGFSLVEVMVVVAIMGMMASAVVLSLPDAGDKLEETLTRTERAMIALERHSVLTGKVVGVRFNSEGFETLVLGDDGWAPADDILKPEATRFGGLVLDELSVNGAALDLLSDQPMAPKVWFLPTGEKTAFSLTLRSPEQAMKLTVPAFGAAEVSGDV